MGIESVFVSDLEENLIDNCEIEKTEGKNECDCCGTAETY